MLATTSSDGYDHRRRPAGPAAVAELVAAARRPAPAPYRDQLDAGDQVVLHGRRPAGPAAAVAEPEVLAAMLVAPPPLLGRAAAATAEPDGGRCDVCERDLDQVDAGDAPASASSSPPPGRAAGAIALWLPRPPRCLRVPGQREQLGRAAVATAELDGGRCDVCERDLDQVDAGDAPASASSSPSPGPVAASIAELDGRPCDACERDLEQGRRQRRARQREQLAARPGRRWVRRDQRPPVRCVRSRDLDQREQFAARPGRRRDSQSSRSSARWSPRPPRCWPGMQRGSGLVIASYCLGGSTAA